MHLLVQRYKIRYGIDLLTYLDFESDTIACLGLQSNKFGFLNRVNVLPLQ